jgi:DnaJ-class molecular chaperone
MKKVAVKKCPNCQGSGRIQVYDLGYSFRGSGEDCSYCYGTGKIGAKMLKKWESYDVKNV